RYSSGNAAAAADATASVPGRQANSWYAPIVRNDASSTTSSEIASGQLATRRANVAHAAAAATVDSTAGTCRRVARAMPTYSRHARTSSSSATSRNSASGAHQTTATAM